MSHELYKTARPDSAAAMVGSGRTLASMIETQIEEGTFPHCSLFTGPSGCGKTTIARIAKNLLGCSDIDFIEMNCASFRGIDMVREIQGQIHQSAMAGNVRIWLIDEAHQLSRDAQNAFLKSLEDTPNHVYFMLATTDPKKLIQTIRTRASVYACQAYSEKELVRIITTSAKRAKKPMTLSDEVISAITEKANGSARQALVMAEQAMAAGSDNAMAVVQGFEDETEAIELARMIFAQKPGWTKARKILSGIEAEPETIRRIILGYAASILGKASGKKADYAYTVIRCFESPFYDSGKAGLLAALYCLIEGEPVEDEN